MPKWKYKKKSLFRRFFPLCGVDMYSTIACPHNHIQHNKEWPTTQEPRVGARESINTKAVYKAIAIITLNCVLTISSHLLFELHLSLIDTLTYRQYNILAFSSHIIHARV